MAYIEFISCRKGKFQEKIPFGEKLNSNYNTFTGTLYMCIYVVQLQHVFNLLHVKSMYMYIHVCGKLLSLRRFGTFH